MPPDHATGLSGAVLRVPAPRARSLIPHLIANRGAFKVHGRPLRRSERALPETDRQPNGRAGLTPDQNDAPKRDEVQRGGGGRQDQAGQEGEERHRPVERAADRPHRRQAPEAAAAAHTHSPCHAHFSVTQGGTIHRTCLSTNLETKVGQNAWVLETLLRGVTGPNATELLGTGRSQEEALALNSD